jgi:1-acyl-sn-glycerol-3-phosphate acyltransferase
MKRMRAVVRLLLAGTATAVLYAIWLAVGRSRTALRKRIVRLWTIAMGRIFGLRPRVEGEGPAGAFLLVANHVSWLDILLLGSLREVVFIAKAEMRGWPIIGPLATSTGTIFIDRGSRRDTLRVSEAIEQAVRDGTSVVLFPEGTSTDGNRLLPFKSALLESAARNTLPVHYAALRYETPQAAWPDDTPFGKHAWQLLQVARIDATVRFGGAVTARDRKELAEKLWNEVSTALSFSPGPVDRDERRMIGTGPR